MESRPVRAVMAPKKWPSRSVTRTSGKSGKSGRSGRSGRSGKRGGVRQGGERHRRKQARKDAEEELQELLAWIRAALVEGVGKVQDPKVQAAVAKKVEDAKVKEMRKDPDFMSSARCELWFALDAASLEVIGLAAKAGCCGEKVALMWLAARPDWLAPN